METFLPKPDLGLTFNRSLLYFFYPSVSSTKYTNDLFYSKQSIIFLGHLILPNLQLTEVSNFCQYDFSSFLPIFLDFRHKLTMSKGR